MTGKEPVSGLTTLGAFLEAPRVWSAGTMEHESESTRPGETTSVLLDALAAADVKRLVRASREGDGEEVEQIRRRYVNE